MKYKVRIYTTWWSTIGVYDTLLDANLVAADLLSVNGVRRVNIEEVSLEKV